MVTRPKTSAQDPLRSFSGFSCMAEKFRSKIGTSFAKKDVEDWQPRLKAELNTLKCQPENRQCFDCGANDVTWASPKLGTFLCVSCSDIHRAAGAHITCVKNFSTYLWSPDEVEMMRLGHRRAQELYRPGAARSWQPSDSKDRKVKLCTELYGTEAVQRAVKQNIAAACSSPAPSPSYAALNAESPNWLDDWTDVTTTNLLDWPVPPQSPVVQRGDSQAVDDLADIFAVTKSQIAPGCRQAVREKDFWDSVNWDELLG